MRGESQRERASNNQPLTHTHTHTYTEREREGERGRGRGKGASMHLVNSIVEVGTATAVCALVLSAPSQRLPSLISVPVAPALPRLHGAPTARRQQQQEEEEEEEEEEGG